MWYSCGCSCSCGDDPCGCQQVVCTNCTTTSTTTAAPCIGEKCDELYNCDCIIYNGPDLACYGIYNGDNLCKILQIAASNLPGCTPPAPTTTTTTLCPCISYTLTNTGKSTFTVSHVSCNEPKETIEYVNEKPLIVCTKRNNIPIKIAGSGTIIPNDPECCTPGNPVPTTISRCTADNEYFGVEQPRNNGANNSAWNHFPYSFKLLNMKLNGIQYVTGTIPVLSLTSNASLNIGVGLDGNTYVMNISDWLNSIAVGSGFTFHDNMRVIDYPYAGATLYIEIEMIDSTGVPSGNYIYDSDNGFSYNNGNIWAGTYTCNLLIN